MATYFLRKVFLLYRLLNTFFLYLVPTKPKPSTTKTKPSTTKTKTSTTETTVTAISPPPCHTDLDELRRVFDMFDKNKDGTITESELGDSFEQMGIQVMGPELGSMIARVDKNGDGCVDINEFEALYESLKDNVDEMKEAFEVFDRDGDGFISADELKAVLGALGIEKGRTVEDCRKMIMKADVDGDGRVDFVEFKQMMTSGSLC